MPKGALSGKHENSKKCSNQIIDSTKKHIDSRKESVKGYLDQNLIMNEMCRLYQKKCEEDDVAELA